MAAMRLVVSYSQPVCLRIAAIEAAIHDAAEALFHQRCRHARVATSVRMVSAHSITPSAQLSRLWASAKTAHSATNAGGLCEE